MLLRRVDERMGLTRIAAAKLCDPRDPGPIRHSLRTLLALRIYGLCCGHEDRNDHGRLREDLVIQTAVGGDEAPASAPTLSRMETRATREKALALHEVLIEQFIAAHERAPSGLVLDVDAPPTAAARAAGSEGAPPPLRPALLPNALRVLRAGDAGVLPEAKPHRREKNVTAVLKLVIGRLRRAWPGVPIIVRGNSGYCRERLMRWCESQRVCYVLGVARNARLEYQVSMVEQALAEQTAASGIKQREIGEFTCAAQGWAHKRRVIARLE